MRVTGVGITLMLVASIAPTPALAFEPGDLLGEWIGEYSARAGGRYRVSWTLTKVEGVDVEGVFHYGGTLKYHNRDTKFTGKLKGNVFSAEGVPTISGAPSANWTFTIAENGKSMTGTFYATNSTTLTLNKGK